VGKIRVICALLLFGGSSALPVASAQSSPASQDAQVEQLRKQLDALKKQINDLQAQLATLEGANANAPQTSPSSSAGSQQGTTEFKQHPQTSKQVGEATSTYTEFSDDNQAAARYDNVPLDPKYAGFFRLPGTDDILKIGGYFKTDFIYDLKPAGNPDAFVPSSFPIPQVASVNNATISIRPTRINLDFRIPSTSLGDVRFYVEADLFGSNATTPRLRHAYAQVKNVLIGQTFSNFMDPDAFPDTLDFQGPNGMISLRNPQFRYGFALSSSTTFYVSVEKPSSDVLFTTPQFTSQPNSPSPDGAIRLRQEFERGHFQVSGVFRSIGAFLPNGRSDAVFGWGVNVSTGMKTWGSDTLIVAVTGGHGVSRYIQDTSGLGIDAEPTSPAHPYLEATPAFGIEASYQHYWIKSLRSSAVYSYAAVDNTSLATPTTYNHGTYTAANLIWNPFGSLNVGAEVLYGWTMEQSRQSANDTRLQFSAKYNFVRIRQSR
jgi:hypothetical protein